MPEMNGRELVERLAAFRPDLKVLFMSGYTDDDVLRRGVMLRIESSRASGCSLPTDLAQVSNGVLMDAFKPLWNWNPWSLHQITHKNARKGKQRD